MAVIEVDDEVARLLRAAVTASGKTVNDTLRAILQPRTRPTQQRDPWRQVPVYVVYLGNRVDGEYLPATGRLRITTGHLAGDSFRSPSGAAYAVVRALNPARVTSVDGRQMWRVAANHKRLAAARLPGPRR